MAAGHKLEVIMSKQQLNVRISDAAREKLDALTQRYGTQTTVIEIAIDHMYREETTMYDHMPIDDLRDRFLGAYTSNDPDEIRENVMRWTQDDVELQDRIDIGEAQIIIGRLISK